jgi:hypothetical protein
MAKAYTLSAACPLIPVRARGRSGSVDWPTPPFRQVLRLTDRIGLLEHADGVVPRHELGYRVDDVARGLVVVCREPSPRDELVMLAPALP